MKTRYGPKRLKKKKTESIKKLHRQKNEIVKFVTTDS